MSPQPSDADSVPSGIPHAVDTLVAACVLALASPMMALAAVAVRLSSPGPILFRQTRVGRNGRPFTLVKFRTMRVGTSGPLVTAKGDRRITSVGRVLRWTKLDELPQLLNVMRGDMALVGPRPEVPQYVDLQSPMWRDVLRLRPGMTDPVTLRLRNEEALMAGRVDRERFYRTVLQPYKLYGYREYLRRRSFAADVGVIMRTVLAVAIPGAARTPSLSEITSVGGQTGADREWQ